MVHIGVLGPLLIEVAGSEVTVSSKTQRNALVFLAMHANEVVSSDLLADAVWHDQASPDHHAVHSLVYRLRHQLEPPAGHPNALVRHDPGYVLNIDPQHVDANLFCARATAGRSLMSAQPNEGRDALASALALWRGEPLLDVAYLPWAAAAIRRLNEVRVGACESLARANLAIGQGELAIAELESLTELHPLRESLWMLLWEALAQADRHLEVMQSYRRFSDVLDREYSITPSTQLADAAAKFADSAGKQAPTS